MKVITERESIQETIKIYSRDDIRRAVREKFDGLDPKSATREEIDNALGSTYWNQSLCCECGKYTPAVIEIGSRHEDESYTALVCMDCIVKATEMLDKTLQGL